MVRARCTMFNDARGFGFVDPLDGGATIFVHRTLLGTEGTEVLAVGELVDVETQEAPQGPRAIWLERVA